MVTQDGFSGRVLIFDGDAPFMEGVAFFDVNIVACHGSDRGDSCQQEWNEPGMPRWGSHINRTRGWAGGFGNPTEIRVRSLEVNR